MRGLSTIIIIILFLMIAIALAALSYTFFVGAFQSVTKSGEQAISKATTSGQALMRIESVSEDKIYIRNIGQVNLSDISVYVGDAPASYTINPEVVPPGQVATITILNAPPGEIEITTAEGALAIQGNYPGYSDSAPQYSGIATNNPATYSTTQVTWMNVTWTDNKGVDYNRTESNYSGSPVNYTPTKVGNVYYLRLVLPAGAHRWRSFANDTANQWNTTTTQTFTIGKATSTVYLWVDSARASESVAVNTIVNYTVQLSTPASGNVELWTNFSNGVYKQWRPSTASPLYNLTNMTVAGVWRWDANYTGNQNYTSDTEEWIVTVT